MHLRHVFTVTQNVLLVLDQLVAYELLDVCRLVAERRHAIGAIGEQMIAVEVIHRGHVERRGGRTLLLVAANVQVLVVRATSMRRALW